MRFNSAEEMLSSIQDGNDYYNPKLELYVFAYNDVGSIACYNVDTALAKSLSQQAKEQEEYWGAFLGCGGHIIDDPSSLQWCDKCYMNDNWINTNDY